MPVYLSRQETGLDRYRLRGHRVGSGMPDDSLRSHARWSLRAVLLDIMPRHAQAAGAFLCCPHASPFETGPKGAKVYCTPKVGHFWGAVQTASAFFVLRTQRNRNPRKVTHPVFWARSGNARYVPKSSAQSRRGLPAQGFAACLRTQPRRVSQPGFGE